jgi:hypothetical protein
VPPDTVNWNVLPVHNGLSIDAGVTTKGGLVTAAAKQSMVALTLFFGELESTAVSVTRPFSFRSPLTFVVPPEALIAAGAMTVPGRLETTL